MTATRPRARTGCIDRLAALAAAAVVAVVLSACSADDPTVGGTTTTVSGTATTETRSATTRDVATAPVTTPLVSTTETPSSVTEGGEQAIVDAYASFWDARFAANSGTPNPADPALRRYATGAQLEAVIAETQGNLDAGRAFEARSAPASYRRIAVVSVSDDTAVVQECFVDDGLVVDRATGAVLNDTIATQSVRGELRKVDGEWRVASTLLLQRWEGVSGCALAP